MPFNYFTYGAACSEVELDTLTGDFQALRTHICMDVGSSVNPAIDIGQVEGGFIQVTPLFLTCSSSMSSTFSAFYALKHMLSMPFLYNMLTQVLHVLVCLADMPQERISHGLELYLPLCRQVLVYAAQV